MQTQIATVVIGRDSCTRCVLAVAAIKAVSSLRSERLESGALARHRDPRLALLRCTAFELQEHDECGVALPTAAAGGGQTI